jgi:hypothetical protein
VATRTLVVLIAAIGVGSTIYHLIGSSWAWALDAGPILAFQLTFLWLYSRGVIGMRRGWTLLLVSAFLLGAWWSNEQTVLNGSLGYAPTLLLLWGLAWFHRKHVRGAPGSLTAAAGLFLVALTFRIADRAVCADFSLGTHFIWHLLAPGAIYFLMRGLHYGLADPRGQRVPVQCGRQRLRP